MNGGTASQTDGLMQTQGPLPALPARSPAGSSVAPDGRDCRKETCGTRATCSDRCSRCPGRRLPHTDAPALGPWSRRRRTRSGNPAPRCTGPTPCSNRVCKKVPKEQQCGGWEQAPRKSLRVSQNTRNTQGDAKTSTWRLYDIFYSVENCWNRSVTKEQKIQ